MTELVHGDFSSLPWHALDFMQEMYLDGAGARLHFAQTNDANGHSMPTIVFLHGVLRDWRSFYPLLTGLRGTANLVSIDFRGHGNSDPTPHAYLVSHYVEDAVRLIKSLANPVILYGHSLGAMVALATAAQIPERIKTAILEDPPFSTMGDRLEGSPLQKYFQAVATVVQNETHHSTVSLAMRNSEAGIQRLFEAFSNIVVGTDPNGMTVRVRDQRDLISRRFSAEGLARIDSEVLAPINAGLWLDGYDLDSLLQSIRSNVVLLRADTFCGGMLTSDEAEHIGRCLAGLCEQIYFPGVGHSMHWAKPKELTELIGKYL